LLSVITTNSRAFFLHVMDANGSIRPYDKASVFMLYRLADGMFGKVFKRFDEDFLSQIHGVVAIVTKLVAGRD